MAVDVKANTSIGNKVSFSQMILTRTQKNVGEEEEAIISHHHQMYKIYFYFYVRVMGVERNFYLQMYICIYMFHILF